MSKTAPLNVEDALTSEVVGPFLQEAFGSESAADVDSAIAAVVKRITDLETLIGESYQVMGALAVKAGVMENPKVIKALDNVSQSRFVHTDILPFDLGEKP